MKCESIRARGVLSLAIALFGAGMAPAQTTIYNSNGFDPPTFTTGPLASFYVGGTGGQQGWLTTDLAQVSSPANGAGQIQNSIVFSPTQAFNIIGNRLVNDSTFSAQTFWFRNFPTFAGSFNPVANGTPFVIVNTKEHVSGTPPV